MKYRFRAPALNHATVKENISERENYPVDNGQASLPLGDKNFSN